METMNDGKVCKGWCVFCGNYIVDEDDGSPHDWYLCKTCVLERPAWELKAFLREGATQHRKQAQEHQKIAAGLDAEAATLEGV